MAEFMRHYDTKIMVKETKTIVFIKKILRFVESDENCQNLVISLWSSDAVHLNKRNEVDELFKNNQCYLTQKNTLIMSKSSAKILLASWLC